MNDIFDINNVSCETIDELKKYEALVLEWNAKFNLISKSSSQYIWDRHIIDSMQLCKFIEKKDRILCDFGSGAGFPGIVIAIIAKKYFPELKIILIESIKKKTIFLNEVCNKLNLNVIIKNERIENIKNIKADVITSRAMASLDKLLLYSLPFCKKETLLLFPKGEKYNNEINIAKKECFFDYKTEQSITSEQGKILCIKNLRRK